MFFILAHGGKKLISSRLVILNTELFGYSAYCAESTRAAQCTQVFLFKVISVLTH